MENFLENNVSLKEKTYYKMGGIARYFATPQNFAEIEHIIHFAKEKNFPIAILGAGSNCVFSDEYFDGVVIALEKLITWYWESDDILYAEGGVTNTEIANICLANLRQDASWMYRMPGQIGASVRMNARCYGGEMSQIVQEILTIDHNGHLNYYDGKKILLGYKNTTLMQKPEIVVGVRFHFPKTGSHDEIFAHMNSCEQDRHKKQHFLYPSCGSTFKNNYTYGKPSGQIFDELGLKGTQKGEAEVSQHHGNFIWNKKFAATEDMLELAAFMRSEAQEKCDVELNLEVQPIGRFNKNIFHSCGMHHVGPYSQDGTDYLTGLFYTPNAKQTVHQENNFSERRLFSSFFMNYYHKKVKNLPPVFVEIWQLQSLESAKKNPHIPFLHWKTICNTDTKDVFKLIPHSIEACEQLWTFSVSEIFFSHPTKSNYIEYEITPYGHMLHLKFQNIREAEKNTDQKTLSPSFEIKQNDKDNNEFGLKFNFSHLENIIENNILKLQCALSLGHEQYFLAPYWETDLNEPADFHKPSRFWRVHLV